MGYYFLFQKRYYIQHPQAKLSNRHLTKLGSLISLVLIVGQFIVLFTVPFNLNCYVVLIIAWMTLFLDDAFSLEK
ncbi:hypothetical protein YK48G_09780 [Lentilactobacillus fungorum]|uniref:Uncharacterized protein n=1 Tax=Lentilactobacillus fungorum TaxID=2201250 RepID=A0ABQ3VYT3_9LACO|nr:hypothetical protein YK48G_09780 [Lentilactobacillus fungorum]